MTTHTFTAMIRGERCRIYCAYSDSHKRYIARSVIHRFVCIGFGDSFAEALTICSKELHAKSRLYDRVGRFEN